MAAWAAAAILCGAAVVQFSAVLHAVLGADPPAAGAVAVAVLAGLLAVAAAAVLLVRVGYLPGRVASGVGWTGARWVAYAGLGGAVLGFAGQLDAAWYVTGPVNLVVSLLAGAVARSEPPDPAGRTP